MDEKQVCKCVFFFFFCIIVRDTFFLCFADFILIDRYRYVSFVLLFQACGFAMVVYIEGGNSLWRKKKKNSFSKCTRNEIVIYLLLFHHAIMRFLYWFYILVFLEVSLSSSFLFLYFRIGNSTTLYLNFFNSVIFQVENI